jgi:hypothetical protein
MSAADAAIEPASHRGGAVDPGIIELMHLSALQIRVRR